MLYLKEANMEDWEKEYDFIINLPDENGFTNKNFGISEEIFKDSFLLTAATCCFKCFSVCLQE